MHCKKICAFPFQTDVAICASLLATNVNHSMIVDVFNMYLDTYLPTYLNTVKRIQTEASCMKQITRHLNGRGGLAFIILK